MSSGPILTLDSNGLFKQQQTPAYFRSLGLSETSDPPFPNATNLVQMKPVEHLVGTRDIERLSQGWAGSTRGWVQCIKRIKGPRGRASSPFNEFFRLVFVLLGKFETNTIFRVEICGPPMMQPGLDSKHSSSRITGTENHLSLSHMFT